MAQRWQRKLGRWIGKRLPRSPWRRLLLVVGAAALSLLVTLNGAVAFFGNSLVNPLSPFHLRAKAHALGRYFAHRPGCLLSGHDDLPEIVARTARRRGVDRWLLAALVEVESGTCAHRISSTGAMGPAQLMPSTAALLGVRDPFDPEQGIDGGARYLKEMLERFRGDARLAVAAYNAGPGNVVHGVVPRNGETEFYVERVLARWSELRPVVRRPARVVEAARQ